MKKRGKRKRHFHQDYPAAQNLIWESGPALSEPTPTLRQPPSGGWETTGALRHLCPPGRPPPPPPHTPQSPRSCVASHAGCGVFIPPVPLHKPGKSSSPLPADGSPALLGLFLETEAECQSGRPCVHASTPQTDDWTSGQTRCDKRVSVC